MRQVFARDIELCVVNTGMDDVVFRLGKRSRKAFEKAVRIVIQSIPTFRVVKALGRERSFLTYFQCKFPLKMYV
jgi:hypothetical protein